MQIVKKTFYFHSLILALVLLVWVPSSARANEEVTFQEGDGALAITIGGKPFAKYVWVDPEIPRPYFCDVKTPSGIQATRNHPPIEGVDRTDHDTFHPGIWLAFGDISGEDSWRLKAPVRQVEWVQSPKGGEGVGSFGVKNVYLAEDGTEICTEICSYEIRVIQQGGQSVGYLLLQDSTFSSEERNFVFGDQEEMGFAFRVATPVSVEGGGTILNSEGLVNQDEVWGKTAAWCDYSGTIDGKKIGMTLIPHPENFRQSWFHARDYGVLLANPFGRKAYIGGEPSAVEIAKGEEFRYRNGVFIYSAEKDAEGLPALGYQTYQERIGKD